MINLFHGDCLELMKTIPDKSIDMVLTSPPYDDLRSYNGANDFNFEKFKLIAKEITRVAKDGTVIVWIVNDSTTRGSESGSSFRQALYFKDELGLNIHDTMIYAKDAISFPDSNRYQNSFEYMFILSKGKPKTFNQIRDRENKSFGRKVTGTERQKNGTTKKASCHGMEIKKTGSRWNIWNIRTEKGNKLNHPAIFPLSLAIDHIVSWSNENDVVMDPFMGSGTTGVACKNLNRKFIGIEKDDKYFEIARQRIGV